MMRRLVEQAHAIVRSALRPGDVAIDATAGVGRDTLVLAESVGAGGRVYALDIQPAALAACATLLSKHGIENVELRKANHVDLETVVSAIERGRVGAAMFNLGYLPGGACEIATRAESTLPALTSTVRLLRPGGVLTAIAYTGHAGGLDEANAVRGFFDATPADEFERLDDPAPDLAAPAPRLFALRRRGDPRGPTAEC